jgi:hypothetical protein
MPGRCKSGTQIFKVAHCDRDVRLTRRSEVRVDAEVKLAIAELEPATAAAA